MLDFWWYLRRRWKSLKQQPKMTKRGGNEGRLRKQSSIYAKRDCMYFSSWTGTACKMRRRQIAYKKKKETLPQFIFRHSSHIRRQNQVLYRLIRCTKFLHGNELHEAQCVCTPRLLLSTLNLIGIQTRAEIICKCRMWESTNKESFVIEFWRANHSKKTSMETQFTAL